MASMTKEEILKAIKENPVAYVATVEGDKPHVRGMAMYNVDETGLYFQAWKIKDVHKQIEQNPNVELCFSTKDGKTIRVAGKFEIVEDMALKKDVETKRPFMTPIIQEKGGYDVVAIYRMNKAKATTWSMAENFVPKAWVELY